MSTFDNKFFKLFRILRLIFYIVFFLLFLLIPTSYFTKSSICFYYNKYHIICPTCGVTRAFSFLMHFQYQEAFMYNPVFTTTFGPMCIFLFTEDLINIVINLFKHNKRYSILEYIFVRYF